MRRSPRHRVNWAALQSPSPFRPSWLARTEAGQFVPAAIVRGAQYAGAFCGAASIGSLPSDHTRFIPALAAASHAGWMLQCPDDGRPLTLLTVRVVTAKAGRIAANSMISAWRTPDGCPRVAQPVHDATRKRKQGSRSREGSPARGKRIALVDPRLATVAPRGADPDSLALALGLATWVSPPAQIPPTSTGEAPPRRCTLQSFERQLACQQPRAGEAIIGFVTSAAISFLSQRYVGTAHVSAHSFASLVAAQPATTLRDALGGSAAERPDAKLLDTRCVRAWVRSPSSSDRVLVYLTVIP
jgi:hypothetical protein